MCNDFLFCFLLLKKRLLLTYVSIVLDFDRWPIGWEGTVANEKRELGAFKDRLRKSKGREGGSPSGHNHNMPTRKKRRSRNKNKIKNPQEELLEEEL